MRYPSSCPTIGRCPPPDHCTARRNSPGGERVVISVDVDSGGVPFLQTVGAGDLALQENRPQFAIIGELFICSCVASSRFF